VLDRVLDHPGVVVECVGPCAGRFGSARARWSGGGPWRASRRCTQGGHQRRIDWVEAQGAPLDTGDFRQW